MLQKNISISLTFFLFVRIMTFFDFGMKGYFKLITVYNFHTKKENDFNSTKLIENTPTAKSGTGKTLFPKAMS